LVIGWPNCEPRVLDPSRVRVGDNHRDPQSRSAYVGGRCYPLLRGRSKYIREMPADLEREYLELERQASDLKMRLREIADEAYLRAKPHGFGGER
jgi:hypothetical protein